MDTDIDTDMDPDMDPDMHCRAGGGGCDSLGGGGATATRASPLHPPLCISAIIQRCGAGANGFIAGAAAENLNC